jgi:hypothetical protein
MLIDKIISLSFSSHDHDILFKQMQHTTTKILLKYSGELSLFTDLCKAVDGYIESNKGPFDESKKAMTLQFETSENLRMARNAAGGLVEKFTSKLSKKLRFHIVVEKFWMETLANVYLSEGKDSKEWKTALYLLDCVLSATDDQDKAKFNKMNQDLPKLIKVISQYLLKHDIDSEWKTTFINQMQEIHSLLYKGESLKTIDDEDLSGAFDIDMIIDDYESEMVADLDTSTIGFEHQKSKNADELLLMERSKIPQDKAADHFLKQLQLGQWMNFLVDSKRTPCFLSYFSKLKETYIFCDRYNQKLFERERADLMKDLTSGYASTLDKTASFEATLAMVVSRVVKASS